MAKVGPTRAIDLSQNPANDHQTPSSSFMNSAARLSLLLLGVLLAGVLAPPGAKAILPSVQLTTDLTGASLVSVSGSSLENKRRLAMVRLDDAGQLDSSLDGDGFFSPRVFGSGVVVALQPDGKILVTGAADSKRRVAKKRRPTRQYFLRRYLSNGSLDSTFGDRGRVQTASSPAKSLFVLPSGNIVQLATTAHSTVSKGCSELCTTTHLQFAKFSSGGQLLLNRRLYGNEWVLQAADMEPNGQIVVAGFDLHFEVGFYESFGRLTTAGRFAPSLGAKEGLNLNVKNPLDAGTNALVTLPDGSFVVSIPDITPTLQRREHDGSLDTAFGENGAVQCVDDSSDGGPFHSLRALPDGAFLAIGGLGPCGVVKYLPSGKPDTSFGTSGRVNVEALAQFRPLSVATGSQGRIVVAGWSDATQSVKVIRLLPDGTLDTSFGSGGIFSFSA